MNASTAVDRVPAEGWLAHWTSRQSHGLTYFDFLAVVDWVDELEVIAHAVNPDTAADELASTRVPANGPRLDSLTPIYSGAQWHEREAREMFGMDFIGLSNPGPLLLRTPYGAPPYKRAAVLAARVLRDWPGAAEPGGSPARRRQRPPGVPEGWLRDHD